MALKSANRQSWADRYGIAPYQETALRIFLESHSLEGARVLEVGGSNLPRALVRDELGARQWVSVDIIDQGRYQLQQQSEHYASERIVSLQHAGEHLDHHDYLILDGAIESGHALPHDYFDAVISITSFEHILAIPAAMAVIGKTKTSRAPFFTYHGPIWSGPYGHHVWVDDELNFNNTHWTVPYVHLLHSPPEVFEMLRRRYGDERAQNVVLQMFCLPRINRFFYEDYERFFRMALSEVEIKPYGSKRIDRSLLRKLRTLHPTRDEFEAYGVIAIGR